MNRRLHFVRQVTGGVARRVVSIDGVARQEWRHTLYPGADLHELRLLFGNVDVAAFGVLRV
jgi:hypothetical protein